MRPPRISFVGGLYHVTVRCNNREYFFKEDSDFSLFLQILAVAKAIYHVRVYAYCLTSNHVHLLLGTPDKANLSQFMQYLNGNFAKAYNRKYGKTGRFWGGRFYSTVMESESQFFNTVLYIEFNMVRNGVVNEPSLWRWSSFHAHAHGHENPTLDFHSLYLALGDSPEARQRAYRQIVQEQMRQKGYTRESTFSMGVIVGTEHFIQALLDKYGDLIPFYRQRKIYPFDEGKNSYSLRHPRLRRVSFLNTS